MTARTRPGSDDPGWRALTVRRVHDSAQVEDLRIPAADVQRVVLLERGSKRIESRSGGRWRAAEHRPGTVSLTAPGRDTHLRWSAASGGPVVTLQVELPGTTVRSAARELWGSNASPAVDSLDAGDDVTAGLVVGLDRARAAGAGELYAQAAAQFLAVHLLTRHGTRTPLPAPVREDRRVAAAQAYVQAHLADSLTLAELAAVADLSPWHFLRVFRTATGSTPMRYVADLRLRTARRLLTTTDRPVTEIAYACGYASPGHLATAFTRRLGTTPQQYRTSSRA